MLTEVWFWQGVEKAALGALESALATAEDAPDVEAARTATAEAAAELAEFDENIPLEDTPEAPEQPEMSRAEMEVEQLVQQVCELFVTNFKSRALITWWPRRSIYETNWIWAKGKPSKNPQLRFCVVVVLLLGTHN